MRMLMDCPEYSLNEEPGEEGDTQASCFYLRQIQTLSITSEPLGVATRCNPDLSKVMQYAQSAWPDSKWDCRMFCSDVQTCPQSF